jgi:hypothetical protein
MEVDEIRRAVLRVRSNLAPGDPYPHDLRRTVVRWARPQREAGRTWRQVSDAIGLSGTTIRNWTRALAHDGGFHQLQVVEAPGSVPASADALRLVSPNGFVVSGGSVEQIAHLLAVLG